MSCGGARDGRKQSRSDICADCLGLVGGPKNVQTVFLRNGSREAAFAILGNGAAIQVTREPGVSGDHWIESRWHDAHNAGALIRDLEADGYQRSDFVSARVGKILRNHVAEGLSPGMNRTSDDMRSAPSPSP